MLTPVNVYQAGYDMESLKMISHAFYGEPARVEGQGQWTLTVRDLSAFKVGKLLDWSLKIYGHEAG